MNLPFLNPWLLAALPAAGIPVIIHLLNRHKSVNIEWGAMDLLRRVMVFRSRQVRLEDVLLMLLRCLAILLVVLAAARPTTRWLSAVKKPDVGVVIALDSSLSMAHRPATVSRFEQAVDRVREILRTVEPGSPVTLVKLGSQPRVLLRNTGYDPARFERLLADPANKPFDEPLNLERGLAELRPLVDEIKAPRRELYIVTDGQASSFANMSEKARSFAGELASAAQVFLATVPAASEDNLAVTRLELAAGTLRTGSTARFQAEVHNFSRSAQDAGELSLLIDEQAVDKRFVGRLLAGQSTWVSLYGPLTRKGAVRVVARLADDALPADNSRYAVVNVRSLVRVLCVDGEPMDRSDGSAAGLVATALAPRLADPTEALPDVERIPWTALATMPSAKLADYDMIVLVNVADVPQDKAVALRKYVEQGGGLVFMPGQNVKPDVFNQRFLASDSSLLPAELVSDSMVTDIGQQTVGWPLDLTAMAEGTGGSAGGGEAHPLVRPLAALPKELLADARFYRFLRVRPIPAGQVLLRLAGAAKAAGAAGATSTGGYPLLLERAIGRGKVLLWASSPDRAWNNLAVNPAFPILMQQTVTYLARQPFESPVTVPEPIVMPLPGLAAGMDVEVANSSDGKAAAQTRTVQAVLRGSAGGQGQLAPEVVVDSGPTAAPGFYQLRISGATAAPGKSDSPASDGAVTVAANVDAAESDVKVATTGELSTIASLISPSVRVLSADQSVAAAVTEARTGRELWNLLLVAAVALLALEALLARLITRRQ